MSDPRLEAITGLVSQVEGAACWLARLATRAAMVCGAAGLVLWWVLLGDRLGDWWQGTAASVLVAALCLAPPAWLLNVRIALHELVELPDTLGGVATRRAQALRTPSGVDRPEGGVLAALRSVRGIMRDYGDVMGSWGTLAQLAVPSFWLLTMAAFAAVPVLAAMAAIAGLVELYA